MNGLVKFVKQIPSHTVTVNYSVIFSIALVIYNPQGLFFEDNFNRAFSTKLNTIKHYTL